MTEYVLYGWTPERCVSCEYYPECQIENGVCPVTQRMPTPEWDNDFWVATEVYQQALHFSGFDMNGMPQLTKLDFVLNMMSYEVQDRERFYEYLSAIHSHKKQQCYEQQKAN